MQSVLGANRNCARVLSGTPGKHHALFPATGTVSALGAMCSEAGDQDMLQGAARDGVEPFWRLACIAFAISRLAASAHYSISKNKKSY